MQGTIERGVYGVNTHTLEIGNSQVAIVYQDTAVVKFSRRMIILTAPDSSKSQTTKLRMNQTSWQYSLGYIVVKRGGQWYVHRSEIVNDKLKAGNRITQFNGDNVKLSRDFSGTLSLLT